uniref:HTH cro/C1-type domain-containing protein n=1 Tax=viral metagenome TaxID=1070528 RepID=A0A6C0AYE1_9ZZZZ|tara:strand:+ start:526 stop:858 length:333 start_codon:yes stop_codon:yes gene_type:complete
MEHQDWNNITFTNKKQEKQERKEKQNSNYFSSPETMKMEAPKLLGQLICQGRNTKKLTQKMLASELQISTSILSRWESNKEFPNNKQIADIEKKLGIKLPRMKKTKVDQN